MPTNVFFNNYNHFGEQNLIEDLVIESIRMYGLDVYYLPRTEVNFDELFVEDVLHTFDDSYMIEMYVKDVDGFRGDGDLMSRFGYQIQDRMTLCVARRRFSDDIAPLINFARPREGDVIYFPLNKKSFEIKHVEHESVFYQMGTIQFYELTVELIEYNSERMNTGRTVNDFVTGIDKEIDSLETAFSLDVVRYVISNEDGTLLGSEDGGGVMLEEYVIESQDPSAQNTHLQQNGEDFIDFSEQNPFSERNVV